MTLAMATPLVGNYIYISNNMSAFDAATASNASGSDSLVEPFDHVTGDRESRILFVAIAYGDVTDKLVGATYNGTAITELYRLTVDAGRLWVGYLVAPDVGTHEVNFSWSPEPVTVARALAITFYNVQQSDPLGQTVGQTQQNAIPASYSNSIDPDAASGLLVDFFHGGRGISGNAQSPQTEVINLTGSWGGSVDNILGCSYKTHSGAITSMVWENLSWNSSAADQYQVIVELNDKPVAQVLGGSII